MDYKNKTDEELVFEAGRAREIDSASVEMTRRLKNEIKKFNDNSTRYSEVLIGLTLILFGVAYFQLIFSLRTITSNWIEWIFFIVIISFGIYFSVIKQVFQFFERKKRKK